jgi:hypothetical protein
MDFAALALSFFMVGLIYWSVMLSIHVTMKLHSWSNKRSFHTDMKVIENDPKALAQYYSMRLVAYAIIAAACVFAAP